jgi:CheY-like chemotaxis protein
VSDGLQALEHVSKEKFDLIFMDIQMLGMDGDEATRKIRNGEVGEEQKNIKIIAMTAYAMNGDHEKFLDAGFDDYISKPIDMNVINLTLTKYFG